MVLPVGRQEYLEVDEYGVLAIPQGYKPRGFHLQVMIPAEARMFVVQKNVGLERGGYHHHALSALNDGDFRVWVMHDPIQVSQAGSNVWTSWHQAKPNRVDVWNLEQDGKLKLFQVGVITHDNGETFRLLGEMRWQGQLYYRQSDGKLVGQPDNPKWGPLSPKGTRDAIFQEETFLELLSSATIPLWMGTPDQISVPIQPFTEGEARIDWYIPFAGQTGQGIAVIAECAECRAAYIDCGNWCAYCKNLPYHRCTAWVHGSDVDISPDEDGVKRLWRNDLISYTGLHGDWGRKNNAPPKLLGPKVISRVS